MAKAKVVAKEGSTECPAIVLIKKYDDKTPVIVKSQEHYESIIVEHGAENVESA